jgi:hypothetical protein
MMGEDDDDLDIEVQLDNEIAVLPPGLVARGEFLSQFKGAVLGEYTMDEEGESEFFLLVRVGDAFRWINVTDAIPVDSDRNYPTLSAVK